MSCRCGGGCAFKTSREGLGLVDTEAIPKIPLSLKKKQRNHEHPTSFGDLVYG